MTKREQRRRERELKRLGYRPLSAAEQVLYIVGYAIKDKLRRLWRGTRTEREGKK